jgi:preprotein translocase subunit SecE
VSADVTERPDSAPGKRGAGVGGFLARVSGFLVSTRAEMSKVTWPTRDELFKATRMILILSVVLGVFIGLMDLVLQKVLVDGVSALAR